MNFPRLMPAALTFFNADLEIDIDLTIEHAKNMLKSGAEGVLFFGTTGEANSLSIKERVNFIEETANSGIEKGKVFWGTGCSNFKDTIQLTETGIKNGFKNFLLLPPFYYKNVSEGLSNYFDIVFSGVVDDVNLFLYHFPAMSGVEITAELLQYLISKYPSKLKGIKDSSGDWQRIFKLTNDFPDLNIYAGNEKAFLRCFNEGCAGIISASFNLQIDLAGKTLEAFFKHSDRMFDFEKRLIENRMLLERFPVIQLMKYLLSVQYSKESAALTRPPLAGLSRTQISEANKLIKLLRMD